MLTRFCHVSGCAELHTPFISISSLGIFSTQTFAGIEIKQKTRFAGKPLLSHASCSTTPDVPNSPDAVITPGPPWNLSPFSWQDGLNFTRIPTSPGYTVALGIFPPEDWPLGFSVLARFTDFISIVLCALKNVGTAGKNTWIRGTKRRSQGFFSKSWVICEGRAKGAE